MGTQTASPAPGSLVRSWLTFAGGTGILCGAAILGLQGWIAGRFGATGILSFYTGVGTAYAVAAAAYAWLLRGVRPALAAAFQPMQVAVMGGMAARMAVVGLLAWTARGSERLHIPVLLLSFLAVTLALLVVEYSMLFRILKRGNDAARVG